MDAADIQKRMRTNLIAFAAILLLALAAAGTVLAGVSNGYLILAIAAAQGTIILTAMMHARAEGPWIRGVLIFAGLFVAALLGLTALAHHSTIVGTESIQPAPAIAPANAETH